MLLTNLINDIIERFNRADLFFGHGTDNAYDEAIALIYWVTKTPISENPIFINRPISSEELGLINQLVNKRVNQKIPLSYLTQEAYFAGLPFYVDQRVIIPRSPIAELIENGFRPWLNPENVLNILDLCTGSGCIAIACCDVFSRALVDATDISSNALDVARINVKKHHGSNKISLIKSDVFNQLPLKTYNLIVSNPPYVSKTEMKIIPNEFLHEPNLALEADDGGLEIAIRILKEAAHYLRSGGILIVEVGNSWRVLQDRYPQVPFLWLEFSRGGEGVFLLTREQLLEHQHYF